MDKFPVTDIFSHIEIADGRVWMLPKGVACFAGDLTEAEQKVVWATHAAPAADLFNQKVEGTATIHEIDSSHVPMLSNPGLVVDVIRTAASALQLR